MGIDLLDVSFRLERTCGVKVTRDDWEELYYGGESRDIIVGDLFGLIRKRIPPRVYQRLNSESLLDGEIDGDVLWLIFRTTLSDCLGVDRGEITKDAAFFRDLGVE